MQSKTRLTAFLPGSFKELIAIALPLIIVSLSENIMIFFDRIILSHYSLISLNAATLASQAIEIFQYGLWAITGMCELFVAGLYAKKYFDGIASPCWQMIYLSLFTLPFVFLLSKYTGGWVLPSQYQAAGLGYYSLLFYSVPLVGIIAALGGFFVGQGEIKLVLFSTIVINLINLALDFALIFGIKNVISPLGATGAALSAVISFSLQIIWLFSIFLNRKNRTQFNTTQHKFNLDYFMSCIRRGFPIAVAHVGEMLAWLLIIKMIAQTGAKNFTIISIGSTLYLIYAFLNDGLYRSISTLMAHHSSANHLEAIKSTLYKGFGLLFIFLFLLALPILFYPNSIIHLFNLRHYALAWHKDIKISFIFIWIYFLLSGIYWVFAALLTARRKTKFIMVMNILSIWFATTLPIYLLTKFHMLSAGLIWPIMCLYVLLGCIGIFIYYKLNFKHLNFN